MAKRTNARTYMAKSSMFFRRPDAPPGLPSMYSEENGSLLDCLLFHDSLDLAVPRRDECSLCVVAAQDRCQLDAQSKVLMQPIHPRKRWRSPRRQPKPVRYQPRPYLLTKNEAAFFRVLNAVVAECYRVSCKVRLADLVTCSDRDWNRGQANRISQKHIDFVVYCVESSRIVAAIELDDASHELPNRRTRDAFVNRLFRQIGVRLIRVPARWQYDNETIAEQMAKYGLLARVPARRGDDRE